MGDRPSTPPPAAASRTGVMPKPPMTPEQVKQLEINRLRAKALREQHDATARSSNPNHSTSTRPNNPSTIPTGSKRPASAISASNHPSNVRDARSATPAGAAAGVAKSTGFRPLDDIQPARNFAKFVEYDFSKMTDTKGGFMTAEDDPHNRALLRKNKDEEEKPGHMTLKEWERHTLLRKLREARAGPFEPGLSVLDKDGKMGGAGKNGEKAETKQCRECGSLEIDYLWDEVLHCRICNKCRDALPEKYSLLTKTEAKEDYLLTDPELRDEELLPHLERPNPHKSTWNNMMLYLRYQVEEYALGPQKWGSGEQLDEEFARREGEKKKRKEDKFRGKLEELKKKTRVEAWRRGRGKGGAGGATFGDEVGGGGKHRHVWGRAVDGEGEGEGVKKCVECGMEVEELEF